MAYDQAQIFDVGSGGRWITLLCGEMRAFCTTSRENMAGNPVIFATAVVQKSGSFCRTRPPFCSSARGLKEPNADCAQRERSHPPVWRRYNSSHATLGVARVPQIVCHVFK